MRLKIISDGTRRGTKVVDDEGREVEGITRIRWHFDLKDGDVWAEITVGEAPIEAVTSCPAPTSSEIESHTI